MYGARIPTSMNTYRSNRQRLRDADAAVASALRDRTLLLAVLAQCGGEVTITAGTVEQMTEHMSYEIVPGANAKEKVIRIVLGDSGSAERAILHGPVGGFDPVPKGTASAGVSPAESPDSSIAIGEADVPLPFTGEL